MPSSLELGMFFRRISYFFLIILAIRPFPFYVYANYRVRAVTGCHALWSRAELQGFRSEIGYQLFDSTEIGQGKSQILV